jgi:hypothetical protein
MGRGVWPVLKSNNLDVANPTSLFCGGQRACAATPPPWPVECRLGAYSSDLAGVYVLHKMTRLTTAHQYIA